MQTKEKRSLALRVSAWIVASLVLATAFTAASQAAQASTEDEERELKVEFAIDLLGANERPNPVDTAATGMAQVELKFKDGAVKWLKLEVVVCDIISVSMAHIHASAGAESTAGVVLFLYGPGPSFSADGCERLTKMKLTGDELAAQLIGIDVDGFVTALTSGQAYINVHTAANPSGEIRGQLV